MYSWLKTAGQYYMALFRKAITLICFLWLKSGKLLSFLLSCTCLMRDGSSFPSPHKARITIPNLGLPFHIQCVCENIYNKYIYSPICCIWSLVSPKNSSNYSGEFLKGGYFNSYGIKKDEIPKIA